MTFSITARRDKPATFLSREAVRPPHPTSCRRLLRVLTSLARPVRFVSSREGGMRDHRGWMGADTLVERSGSAFVTIRPTPPASDAHSWSKNAFTSSSGGGGRPRPRGNTSSFQRSIYHFDSVDLATASPTATTTLVRKGAGHTRVRFDINWLPGASSNLI